MVMLFLKRFDYASQYAYLFFDYPFLDLLKFLSCVFLFKLLRLSQPLYNYDALGLCYSIRMNNLVITRHTSRHMALFFVMSGLLDSGIPRHIFEFFLQ